jgi:glycine dehydrogenase
MIMASLASDRPSVSAAPSPVDPAPAATTLLPPFVARHIGPREDEIAAMVADLGYSSLEELTRAVVPAKILNDQPLDLPAGLSEEAALSELQGLAAQNQVLRSLIGQGYYGTHTPKVIQRNVLENPAWYTAYTPYQPEISQGRLEILFYFQTMISELTGLPIANASLLDEATAAAEAMTLCQRSTKGARQRFLVSQDCHPQTIQVVVARAKPLQIDVVMFDESRPVPSWDGVFGVLVQYPGTTGQVRDFHPLCEEAHAAGALVVAATDLLALVRLKSPGSFGADVAIGSAQRFGVPLGLGGPHAAFMATRDELKRTLPGRLVGQSIDRHGNPAYRLSLQTREQHIRREKATSNICTAQALLAIMATLYAMYHGPVGLRQIANRVHDLTARLAAALRASGWQLRGDRYFDTLVVDCGDQANAIWQRAEAAGYNLRRFDEHRLGISVDETTTPDDLQQVLRCFGSAELPTTATSPLTERDGRQDTFLTQEVFHNLQSETQMMRYLRRLSEMDLALDRAMIPLGSCTMKLNAASELTPVTWPQFNNIHPFAPSHQWVGYQKMVDQLEAMLCEITGYDQVSLQPNAGSQGEYAGLLAIKAYHESRGDLERDVCLIPSSAHGTNPASAQMANMKVVVVKCDSEGNVDLEDLQAKIHQHTGRIAAIMITYPSTHGVFEATVTEVCRLIHEAGGQVYIDGANMNALVGLAKVGKFGGDVSHLNLHKTFCIPHGGGGPGVGPVCVARHLAPFLPHDGVHPERQGAVVSAAPFGSASILPISWMYIRMMGPAGLRKATQVAILNANYIAKQLRANYPILYAGTNGLVAHECILDTRPLDKAAKVSVDDIAKRLIDYGFHAPTMSFPVAGTLMIEPTESEPKSELDRFCRAMNLIYQEFLQVQSGQWPADDNPLHNAPHTLAAILDEQPRSYSRQVAVCPDPSQDWKVKYFPPVGRVDNAYGDRNLVCSCPPLTAYAEEPSSRTEPSREHCESAS